jgi:hypothetical protein
MDAAMVCFRRMVVLQPKEAIFLSKEWGTSQLIDVYQVEMASPAASSTSIPPCALWRT